MTTTGGGSAIEGRRPVAAILAGGRALRFGGRPKGLELVGGERIVDRVARVAHEVASEVLLIGAPAAIAATIPGCRAIADEAPGNGPLGAIVSALRASGVDTLVVGWDMPFVTVADLQPLLHAPDDAAVVLWENEGHVEPLCALYRSTALAALAAAFAAGERSPRAALRQVHIHLIARPSSDRPSPFISINTTEQLEAARRIGPAATR